MSGVFTFIFVLSPFFSQISAFGRCDEKIVCKIRNSNLTPTPPPKIARFQGQSFKFLFISASDKNDINSAVLILDTSNDNKTVTTKYIRYLGESNTKTSVSQTFTDVGDPFSNDVEGYIDSGRQQSISMFRPHRKEPGPTSKNRGFVWEVRGLAVSYFCSLDGNKTGTPQFSINALLSQCEVTEEQIQACKDSINTVNNYIPVSMAELTDPPGYSCN